MFEIQHEKTDSESEQVKNTALRYLARREHSRLELIQKLNSKYASPEKVDAAIRYVDSKGYLSDERYADLIVRSRINAFYGPLKIRMELRAKGVSDEIIESVIDEYAVDWSELALKARTKHFGFSGPEGPEDHLKQFRYLKNRGFYHEHIDLNITYPSQAKW